MKDLLQFLSEWFLSYGLPGIASALAMLIVGLPVLVPLVKKLWKILQQRQLLKDLHPFYTAQEIQRATQYYVETKCQNVAPSKEDEPGGTYEFAAKERIIPFFLKKAFKRNQDDCQFYIVLAGSGMGKTTFLINLYLRYISQFFGSPYRIKLFPLGFPNIDAEIDKIPDAEKGRTILLLDAFDEDRQALHSYRQRMDQLIQKGIHFREMVVTCRTQFFPSEEEEPKETGVMRFGVEGGSRVFRKFYVSPFDHKDIHAYLRKRFGWGRWLKKRKARRIVLSCPKLMVRPMLLSHIEDLLQREKPYTAAYQVYAELIHKWIEREIQKVPPDRRERYRRELFRFSREIAVDIYRHRDERQGALLIPGEHIQPFADKHRINLHEMEMKSRSLLNRNAFGDYKFSHKSILEYFLAEKAFFNQDFREELDFDSMDQAKAFFGEMISEQLTLPFFSQPELKGQYSIGTDSSQALATLPAKSLPRTLSTITSLKLYTWTPADDAVLLAGLPNLKQLEFVGDIIESTQVQAIQRNLPECKVTVRFNSLRSQPMVVSSNEFLAAFELEKAKPDKDIAAGRPREYTQNEYGTRKDVVFDYVTGLTWERVGSKQRLAYTKTQTYITDLNRQKFAGYDDWRLPTIPELMSLIEPKQQSNKLSISPIFSVIKKRYFWYWSSDLRQEKNESSPGSAWVVSFSSGIVGWLRLGPNSYVRAVRSWQE